MKKILFILAAALMFSLLAVVPQSVRADSMWPKEAEKKSEFSYTIYTVRRGDTLEHIARNHSSDSYQISVADIMEISRIKNPNRILVGQKLRLPAYYAKEVQAEMPATVQAAVEAAVAPKEAALVQAKNIQWMLLGSITILILSVVFFVRAAFRNAAKAKSELSEEVSETPESEKFLSYPDEIRAKLQKCTGQEIAELLESEFVEIPRGPGSAATNKVKFKNVPDLMKKYPELWSMPPELWHGHIFAKENKIAPAKETA